MNILFLTSITDLPSRFYLINELNKYHPIKKVFFQTKFYQKTNFKQKFKKFIKNPKILRLKIRNILKNILLKEEKLFFKKTSPSLNPLIPSEKIFSFNSPETLEKIKKEKPDLILIYGTEILKGDILKVTNILNIHPAILPKYRGDGFPEWVFYNKDFKNLGVTIHVCAQKLDQGDIVGQKYYEIQKQDNNYELLKYKITNLTLDLLKETIKKYKEGKIEYKKQGEGMMWRSRDLTITKQIIAKRNFNKYIKNL